jgi:O-methyltransferase
MMRDRLKQALKNLIRRTGYVIARSDTIDGYRRRLEAVSDCDQKLEYQRAALVEYQKKLERAPDYQAMMALLGERAGMLNLEPEFLPLFKDCRAYTMTSWECMYALWKSVIYVVENEIPGAFVECGVWRGGSMRLVAKTLLQLGVTDRDLYLYDTFTGMTKPTERDVDYCGNRALPEWEKCQKRDVWWSYASKVEVMENMRVGYRENRMFFVEGPVEQTLHVDPPGPIALLRLDTDWYESTRCEMQYLYPRLEAGGVLILDDYGEYDGARAAVDEFFSVQSKPLLNRVDYSCRLMIKHEEGMKRDGRYTG